MALIAIALVALLAITALAIDGGNAFSARRKAQSAADDAALAGGLAKIGSQDIAAAVLSVTRAAGNDFPDSTVTLDEGAPFTGCNGETVNVTHYITSHNPTDDDSQYLQVKVRSSVNAFFGPVIGIRQMNYCVQAIVRAKPFLVVPAFFGNAVVGTDPNALSYDAHSNSQNWEILGGGVFANNDADDAHSNVSFPDGHCATAVGEATGFTCPASSGNPQLFYDYPDDIAPLMPPTPDCDGTAKFNTADSKIHEDDDPSKNGSVWDGGFAGDYASGLYCITDAGGNIHSPITGTGVTFYISDTDFTLKFNGGGYIAASAPTEGTYKGVLIFGPITDTPCSQNMEIRGNGSTPIVGSIFLPSACINYLGNGTGIAMDSQIVGYQVYSNGTAFLKITYDNDDNWKYPQPPILELTK
jgi:Putative Flp pilus-assembly TadE/G-like